MQVISECFCGLESTCRVRAVAGSNRYDSRRSVSTGDCLVRSAGASFEARFHLVRLAFPDSTWRTKGDLA